jgi:hypothetical protein
MKMASVSNTMSSVGGTTHPKFHPNDLPSFLFQIKPLVGEGITNGIDREIGTFVKEFGEEFGRGILDRELFRVEFHGLPICKHLEPEFDDSPDQFIEPLAPHEDMEVVEWPHCCITRDPGKPCKVGLPDGNVNINPNGTVDVYHRHPSVADISMMKVLGVPALRNWLKGMCITGLRFVNRDIAGDYLHRMGWFRHSLMELAKNLRFDPLQSNLPFLLPFQDLDDKHERCLEVDAVLSLIPGLVKDFGSRSFCLCDWWFVAVLVNVRFTKNLAKWYDIDAFKTLINHIDLYERESRIHTSELVLDKILQVRTVRNFDLKNRSIFREGGVGIFCDRDRFRLKRLATLAPVLRQASSEAFESRDTLDHLFKYLNGFLVPAALDRDGTRPKSYCPTTLLQDSTLLRTSIVQHALRSGSEDLFQSHLDLAGGDNKVFHPWWHVPRGASSCGTIGFPAYQVSSCPDGSLEVFFQYPTKVALDKSFKDMAKGGDFMLAVHFPFGSLSWFDAYVEQYGFFRDQLKKYATVRLDSFNRNQLQYHVNKGAAQDYLHVVHFLLPLFSRIRDKFGEDLICMSDRYLIYQWEQQLLFLRTLNAWRGYQGGVSQAFTSFCLESDLVFTSPQQVVCVKAESDAQEFFSKELDPAQFDSSIHEHGRKGYFEGVLRRVIQVPNGDVFGEGCPGPFGNYSNQRSLYAVGNNSYSHSGHCAEEEFVYTESFDKEVPKIGFP